MLAVHEDVACRVRVFAEDSDVGRRLHDLKRVRRVHRAGHAEQPAFRLCILSRLLAEVLLLRGKHPRLVWNLVPFDDALARGHAEARRMILQIPVRRTEGLPHAVQIGLAVPRARQRRITRRGRLGRHRTRDKDRERRRRKPHCRGRPVQILWSCSMTGRSRSVSKHGSSSTSCPCSNRMMGIAMVHGCRNTFGSVSVVS